MSEQSLQIPNNEIYKFLDFFQESEEDIAKFAGRDADISEVIARIVSSRVFILYGRSGLGKTSLLQAGVFPGLRTRGYLPIYIRTRSNPLEDLTDRVRAVAADWELQTASYSLQQALAEMRRFGIPVLVFDQFEEFFIRFRELPSLRGAFISTIAQLGSDSDLGLRLVFSIREDYLADLDAVRDVFPEMRTEIWRLRSLTAFGARQAILQPLIRQDIAYDPRLVRQLVHMLAEVDYDPIFLQITCSRLLDNHNLISKNHTLDLQALSRIGDLDLVFRQYLDTMMSQFTGNMLVVRIILNALISHEKTKNAVPENFFDVHFVAKGEEKKQALIFLENRRLIRREEKDGQAWFELIHDRLVNVVFHWVSVDRAFSDYRAAREQVLNAARSGLWRTRDEVLLEKGKIQDVVAPFRDWLCFEEEQMQMLMTSIIFHQSDEDHFLFWSDRLGLEETIALTADLIVDKRKAMRLGAARVALWLPTSRFLCDCCLTGAFEDNDADVRLECSRALERQLDEEGFEVLRDRLRHREKAVRVRAYETLGELSPEKRKSFRWLERWRAKRALHRRLFNDEANRAFIRSRMPWGTFGGFAGAFIWGPVCLVFAQLTEWLSGFWVLDDDSLFIIGLIWFFGLFLGAFQGWRASRRAARLRIVKGQECWVSPALHSASVWIMMTLALIGILVFPIQDKNSDYILMFASISVMVGLYLLLSCLVWVSKRTIWPTSSWWGLIFWSLASALGPASLLFLFLHIFELSFLAVWLMMMVLIVNTSLGMATMRFPRSDSSASGGFQQIVTRAFVALTIPVFLSFFITSWGSGATPLNAINLALEKPGETKRFVLDFDFKKAVFFRLRPASEEPVFLKIKNKAFKIKGEGSRNNALVGAEVDLMFTGNNRQEIQLETSGLPPVSDSREGLAILRLERQGDLWKAWLGGRLFEPGEAEHAAIRIFPVQPRFSLPFSYGRLASSEWEMMLNFDNGDHGMSAINNQKNTSFGNFLYQKNLYLAEGAIANIWDKTLVLPIQPDGVWGEELTLFANSNSKLPKQVNLVVSLTFFQDLVEARDLPSTYTGKVDIKPINDRIWLTWSAPNLGAAVFEPAQEIAIYNSEATRMTNPFDAIPGQDYYILAIPAREEEPFVLRWELNNERAAPKIRQWSPNAGSALSNDLFETATPIPLGSLSNEYLGNSEKATSQPGEPHHNGIPPLRSTWWRWDAPIAGNFQLSVQGPRVNLAVYSGSDFDSLKLIAGGVSNGDSASARFHTGCGRYYIMVDTLEVGGDYTLIIKTTP